MKYLVAVVLAFLALSTLHAQTTFTDTIPYNNMDKKASKKARLNAMLRMEEEGQLIFNKQSIFGIRLATDGYGISYEKGKFKTNRKALLYQFEFNEKKDPKDHKVAAAGYNGYNFSSVVVGKLNNFYQFKAAIGQQYLIGGKGNKNGVAVTAIYTGGLSLGMLKPYYVQVENTNTGQDFRSKYPTIIDSGWVELGASGFTVGLGEMTFKPGVNAKFAMRFDYGRLNQTVSAIEAGVTGEFYFSKIPMVYLVPYKQFFFNAYMAILFGRRK